MPKPGRFDLMGWLRWRVAVVAPLCWIFLFHLYFGGNQTVASLLMALGLALCVLATGAASRGRLALAELGRHWPLAIFAISLLSLALWSLGPSGGASAMWSSVGVEPPPATLDRSATLVEIVKFGGTFSAFVLGFLATRRRDGGKIALVALQALALTYAVWAMSRYASRQQFFHGGRLTGGFGSPNTAATLMAAMATICAGQVLSGLRSGYSLERWLVRVALPGLVSLALLSGLAMTGSRAGLLFGLAGCAIVLVMALFDPKIGRIKILLLGGGGVALVVIATASRLTQSRSVETAKAAAVRFGMLGPHWDAFKQQPLFGYGWGSFDVLNQTLLPLSPNFNSAAQIRALHNVYLQTLVEVGGVGLASFGLIVGYVFVLAAFNWSTLGERKGLAAGVMGACLVFLAHGAVDYALQVPSMAAQWSWLLGALLGLGTPSAMVRRRAGHEVAPRRARRRRSVQPEVASAPIMD